MAGNDRSREELIAELEALRSRVAALERSQADRDQAEAAARENEALFRALIALVDEGVIVMGGDGSFKDCNAGAERILGLTAEELSQRPILDPGWQMVFEDGSPFPREELPLLISLRTGQPRLNTVMGVRQPGGEVRWLRVSSSPVMLEGDAGPRAALTTFVDLTEHRQAVDALHRERDLVARIAETSPVGIVVVNGGGAITFANTHAERVLGLERDDIVKRQYDSPAWHITDLDGQPFPEDALPFRRVIDTGQPIYDMRHAIQWPDGRRVLLSISGAPLFDPAGELHEAVFTLEDITERLQAEYALAESELRYRSIVQSIPMGLHLYNLDDADRLIFSGANLAADRIAGVDNTQFLGKTLEDAFPPMAGTEVPERFRLAAAEGISWHTDELEYDFEGITGTFEAHAFQTAPRQVTALFADVAERKRVERERQQYTERLRYLREIDQAILAAESPEAIALSALDRLQQLVPFMRGSVTVIDAQAEQAVVLAVNTSPDQPVDLPRVIPLSDLYQRSNGLWQGEPYTAEDLLAFDPPGRIEQRLLEQGVRAYVNVPLMVRGELIGTVNLGRPVPGSFTQAEMEIAREVADQLAIAIQQARLFRSEQERRQIAETLLRATAVVSSTLELDAVLGLILHQLREVIDFDTASIQQRLDDHMLVLAGEGFREPANVIGLTFALDPIYPNYLVVKEKRPLALTDVTEAYPAFDSEDPRAETTGIRAWLGLPLLLKDEVIGMITIDRFTMQPFTEEDVTLATAFAHQAAIALDNARLYKQVQQHAVELEERVEARTAELQREKDHVEAVLSSTADAMLIVDRNARVRSVNPAFERLTGWSREDLLGQPIGSETYTSSRERLEHLLEAGREGRAARVELVALRPDGTEFDADVNMAPLRSQDGEVYGYVLALRDISAWKEIERMREAFVSNVSHELRTPITNLKIRQHLLRRQPDQVDVHLPVIARETDRLSHIIDDLLSLSRMDQGRVELDLQPVDLNQLAQQYVDDRTPLAQQRELTLRFVGAPGLPRVRADEGMLGQALSILLTNALNYTPAGGTVTVEVRDCRQGPDPWGCVAVSDTGPGIQPEEMPQLFERFFRGSAAEITRSRGTGLGLAILKEIITRHGGRVEVESEGIPGKGAVFLLWLPCGGAPAAGEAAQRG